MIVVNFFQHQNMVDIFGFVPFRIDCNNICLFFSSGETVNHFVLRPEYFPNDDIPSSLTDTFLFIAY